MRTPIILCLIFFFNIGFAQEQSNQNFRTNCTRFWVHVQARFEESNVQETACKLTFNQDLDQDEYFQCLDTVNHTKKENLKELMEFYELHDAKDFKKCELYYQSLHANRFGGIS